MPRRRLDATTVGAYLSLLDATVQTNVSTTAMKIHATKDTTAVRRSFAVCLRANAYRDSTCVMVRSIIIFDTYYFTKNIDADKDIKWLCKCVKKNKGETGIFGIIVISMRKKMRELAQKKFDASKPNCFMICL